MREEGIRHTRDARINYAVCKGIGWHLECCAQEVQRHMGGFKPDGRGGRMRIVKFMVLQSIFKYVSCSCLVESNPP